MENILALSSTLKKLKVPYNKHFYNIPFSQYEALAETIGVPKVNSYMRDILVFHKDDQVIAEKARKIIKKLDKLNKLLNERITANDNECECGYLNLSDDEFCPVCNHSFYNGTTCFYKTEDFCTADGEECRWLSQKDCGKQM
jgi:hypothetical protein